MKKEKDEKKNKPVKLTAKELKKLKGGVMSGRRLKASGASVTTCTGGGSFANWVSDC